MDKVRERTVHEWAHDTRRREGRPEDGGEQPWSAAEGKIQAEAGLPHAEEPGGDAVQRARERLRQAGLAEPQSGAVAEVFQALEERTADSLRQLKQRIESVEQRLSCVGTPAIKQSVGVIVDWQRGARKNCWIELLRELDESKSFPNRTICFALADTIANDHRGPNTGFFV